MRSRPARRAAPAVVAAGLAALALAALLPIGAAAGGGATKAEPTPYPENATVSEPGEPTPGGFTVPTQATPPSPSRCPSKWSYFSNPVLHVSHCVPPGWGFSSFTSSSPLAKIASNQLENVHLLSPGAFPWTTGMTAFDAITKDKIVEMEFDILEAGATWKSECEPTLVQPIGGQLARWCDQSLDAAGLPASSGPINARKVIIPLPTTPQQIDPGFDPAGALLLVIVRSPSSGSQERDTAWTIVESIVAS